MSACLVFRDMYECILYFFLVCICVHVHSACGTFAYIPSDNMLYKEVPFVVLGDFQETSSFLLPKYNVGTEGKKMQCDSILSMLVERKYESAYCTSHPDCNAAT